MKLDLNVGVGIFVDGLHIWNSNLKKSVKRLCCSTFFLFEIIQDLKRALHVFILRRHVGRRLGVCLPRSQAHRRYQIHSTMLDVLPNLYFHHFHRPSFTPTDFSISNINPAVILSHTIPFCLVALLSSFLSLLPHHTKLHTTPSVRKGCPSRFSH